MYMMIVESANPQFLPFGIYAMELHTLPTHRLFQKLHHFRKKDQIRSNEALGTNATRADDKYAYVLPPISTDLQSLRQTHKQQASAISLPDLLPDPDDPLSQRSPLPTYTPMTVPKRVSSALKEHEELTRSYQSQDLQREGDEPPDINDAQNDVVDFSGFNDDLLQQPPSVSASPHRGRSRPGSPAMRTIESRQPRHMPSIERCMASPLTHINSQRLKTAATLSENTLAQLQTPSPDKSDILNSKLSNADDPESWDVVRPGELRNNTLYSLERRAELLYSADHLRTVLEDPALLSDFTNVLQRYRPWRIPLLSHYLAVCKALRALDYANALAKEASDKPSALPSDFRIGITGHAVNISLQDAAKVAFEALLKDDLHYYITNTWIGVVSKIVQRRVTGTLPARLRETSNGLAEVFCVTDPKLQDNPIILASEAFTRHSGCSLEYVLGRNCRFMQGPGTTIDSCRRFAISCQETRDHTEIFVNYRRDGSPFLSLVFNAPLIDSRGNVRYFLGAQVDVSGLLKNCSGMESLRRVVEKSASEDQDDKSGQQSEVYRKFQALSQMLSDPELDIVRKTGGTLHKGGDQVSNVAIQDRSSIAHSTTRVILEDLGEVYDQTEMQLGDKVDPTLSIMASLKLQQPSGIAGNLAGVYKYYVLLRPAPSLRILFASPTMRVPGILQSRFLDRIGGSIRMREDLGIALQQGEAVTARVRWLHNPSPDGKGEGKSRWVHCTPLKHYSGAIGLWMVVMVTPSLDESVGSRLGSVSKYRA